MAHPLDGIRVLDLSRALSGPYAGRILSDLGADVVKVEMPGADITQAFGRITNGRSGLYSQLNVGKRSVVLNLREAEDAERFRDLVRVCDIVVENFRPGVLARLGLNWEALSAVNPRLLMLSISGFGQSGPDARRQAYAPIIHAETGVIGRQAQISGEAPADIAFALADSLAGLHGTVALLAALRLREITGQGQHVDLSMFDALLATDDYTHYSIDDQPVWAARGEVWDAPGGPILISSDRRHTWKQLSVHFGLTDADPESELAERLEGRMRLMAKWIASHSGRDGLKGDLEQAGLAWADIRYPQDVLKSPTAQARQVVLDVADSDGFVRRVVRQPYRFSEASSGPSRGVPLTGEHTDNVFSDWLSR